VTDFKDEVNLSWVDTTSCFICNSQLGKRRLVPRHHCRLCGRCVCAGCSPHLVKLPGSREAQRVCTHCISDAAQTRGVLDRLERLAKRLFDLAGVRSTSTSPSSLLEAVVACESVIAPLEEQIVNSAEVQAARLTCLRLEQRIRELSGTPSLVTDHSIGLEEALALCGAALTPLEAAQRRATALGEVGPLCSSPAETVIDAAISPLGDELPRQPGLEAEPRAANTSATAERAARLLLRRRCFRALGLLLLAAMLTMTFLAINLDLPQKLHQWLSAKGLWGSSWFEPQLASSRSEGVQSWTPMRHERN